MRTELRIGVIGTGWWADFMHLPSIKSHQRAHLTAICGRNRDRTDELAAKYGVEQVFTDYRDMIARADLDAIVVAAPDHLHYPITMAALDARLHVMCEKPLANSAGQAREMYEKAEAAGVKHGVFFTWPWLSHYTQLQRLLAEGYIGRPFQCSLSYLAGYGRAPFYQWRFDADCANGALADLGSHMIHLARLYVGDIASVSAHLGSFTGRNFGDGPTYHPANDAAVLAIEFVGGAHGTIQVSAVADVAERGQEQRVALHGDAGTLESALSFAGTDLRGVRTGDECFRDLARGDDRAGAPVDPMAVFRTQSVGDREFIDAILDDRPFAPSFEEGWRVQQVVDAAIRSHNEELLIKVS